MYGFLFLNFTILALRMSNHNGSKEFSHFRERLYEIIFEADTPAGRTFDIVLLIAIVGSVIAVMLETVPSLKSYVKLFVVVELSLIHI